MTERTFDVVVFGATGFSGKLVAEHLAKNGPKDLEWAIAGRNREKLEALRRELGRDDVEIRLADAHDEGALEPLIASTRVVCATAGPFAKHGLLTARLAAKHGTHYCDITGEPTFVRQSIDENHETAAKTGARIVHCCGFDSVPSDLGVHMMWDAAKNRGARGLHWAKAFFGEAKGGFSGGTVASIANLMEDAGKNRDVRRLLGDPHGLDPEPPGRTTDPFEQDQRGVRYDSDIERWTAPFLMATVNTRIVRRSNALVDGRYGASFRYHEAMSFMPGMKGLAYASAVTAGIGGLAAALVVPATRKMIMKKLGPGDGPSRDALEKGFFKMRLVAETDAGEKLRGRVEGRDAYLETGTMAGEAAICLARDTAKLPKVAGVLTPASAMGMTLVERLRAAGMTFNVEA